MDSVTLGGDPIEDTILTLDDNPQLDDALIVRLTYDLATRMHPTEVIARRYGLRDVKELREYLRSHPQIVTGARKMRALFESDADAEARVRMKFLHAAEHLIPAMTGLVHDPRTPLTARIDGFKQIQRGAGLDGLSQGQRQGKEAQQGQAFNLTINFAGGRELFHLNATTVVEGEPPLPALTLADEGEATGIEIAEGDV